MSHLPSWFCASPERSSLRALLSPRRTAPDGSGSEIGHRECGSRDCRSGEEERAGKCPYTAENQPIFESSETAGKPQQIN